MNNNMKQLKEIYYNLNNDYMYGKTYSYGFDAKLCLTLGGNIYWCNYGSSCEKNTLEDLYWVITTIFETTPKEFMQKYELKKRG